MPIPENINMGYSATVGLDYILFSGKSKTKETRCWHPFAQCPFTNKMLFGKKCTKIIYNNFDLSKTVYVDSNEYAYRLMMFADNDWRYLDPDYILPGRVGPKPGY